jgi:hypothetical protein
MKFFTFNFLPHVYLNVTILIHLWDFEFIFMDFIIHSNAFIFSIK